MSYNNQNRDNKYIQYFFIPMIIGVVIIMFAIYFMVSFEQGHLLGTSNKPADSVQQVTTSQPVTNSKELIDVTNKVNGLSTQMNALMTEMRNMSIDGDLKIPAITCTRPSINIERLHGYQDTYLEARYKQDELATKALIECEEDKRDIISEKIKLETVKECNKAFAKGLRPAVCFNND